MNIKKASQFSAMASLIGEPARAIMLWRLLGGKALTATELAIGADVSVQSASMHLTKLVKANILSVIKQGRHRYFRLAIPEVAYILEAIANLVPGDKLVAEGSGEPDDTSGFRYCRTCYDHLAGKVGVAITERLVERKIIAAADGTYAVTPEGVVWFAGLDISVAELKKHKRSFARQCLDWSERRYHLSGSLGAALLGRMFSLQWLQKINNSRTVLVTGAGQTKIYELLELNL